MEELRNHRDQLVGMGDPKTGLKLELIYQLVER